MNNTKKGFTLVELLVVIAILAILATVSVVGYTSFIDRANQSNADTEAHQIATAIDSYIISGQDYVLATVGDPDDTTKSYKVYTVKASDGLLYVTTYTYATDKWTSVETEASGDVTEAFKANDDFKALCNTNTTFVVATTTTGEGANKVVTGQTITYTPDSTEASVKSVITLK